jgi:hypothetical protein
LPLTRLAPAVLLACAAPDAPRPTDSGVAPGPACGLEPPDPAAPLPDRVWFRTPWASFNTRWQVALHEGQVWMKSLEGGDDWTLAGGTGLPYGGVSRHGAPAALRELSADGMHLHVLSDEGHFYRGTDLTTDVRAQMTWTDGWGGALGEGPGLDAQFSTACGWSVSDSFATDVREYTDTNGTVHSVGLGVAHQYRLSEDGRRIYLNDWWLPPDWSRQVCGPDNGQLSAANLSASASTLFVIGEGGAIYTRLYDVDIGGENPLLTYSYIVGPGSGTTRRLPSPPWIRQPDVPGRPTTTITIFQDGVGNDARVLRVAGEQGGVIGRFEKRITDAAWTFTEDPAATGRFVDELTFPDPAQATPLRWAGTIAGAGGSLAIRIEAPDLVCSPAGVTLTAGGAEVEVPLHFAPTFVTGVRPRDFREQGDPDSVQAALLIEDLPASGATGRALAAVFGDREVINFTGAVGAGGVDLEEIPWYVPFRVPAEEKPLFDPLRLTAAPSEPPR